MEESRGARLQRNLEALQADLAFAQDNKEQMAAVARAAEQYIAEQHSRMAAQEAATRAEAERRATVCAMRRSVGEEGAANEERRQRLKEVQERVAQLRVGLTASCLPRKESPLSPLGLGAVNASTGSLSDCVAPALHEVPGLTVRSLLCVHRLSMRPCIGSEKRWAGTRMRCR